MALSGQKLSASTNGRAIKVVATGTPGTTIHAADATANDYISLYAYNSSDSAVDLTLEWGGTTSPDDLIVKTLPPKTEKLVASKRLLTGSLEVKAFAGTANVVMIHGSVDRVS